MNGTNDAQRRRRPAPSSVLNVSNLTTKYADQRQAARPTAAASPTRHRQPGLGDVALQRRRDRGPSGRAACSSCRRCSAARPASAAGTSSEPSAVRSGFSRFRSAALFGLVEPERRTASTRPSTRARIADECDDNNNHGCTSGHCLHVLEHVRAAAACRRRRAARCTSAGCRSPGTGRSPCRPGRCRSARTRRCPAS